MFERTIIKKLNDYIYLLDDNHQATGYLVLGAERALLIDTMNGMEDLKAVVDTLTDLPVTVVNTHGHPDHIGGNGFFGGKAYMNSRDLELAHSFTRGAEKALEFLPVDEGDVFDLGGVKLEVFAIPGHTPGGILLFNRADGTLFTGDSINWNTWMQLTHSLPMHTFLNELDRLAPLFGEVKRVLHGHAQDFDGPELIEYHREAVRELTNGQTQNDEDSHYFGGTVKAHPYKDTGLKIIYDPARPM